MRIAKTIFIIICLSAATIIWATQASGQNLVTNPDFVDGQNGWAMYAGNAAANWEVLETGGVADGTQCAFAEITALDGANWYTPNLYTGQVISLQGVQNIHAVCGREQRAVRTKI